MTNERVHRLMQEIDPKAAEAEAEEYWSGPAKAIIEPKRAEIIESARLFLAILETSTSPMACRTLFAQSVPDARRLFLNWGRGQDTRGHDDAAPPGSILRRPPRPSVTSPT